MVEYRIFKVSPGGLIDSGQVARLADDAAALDYARSLNDPRLVEVWSGSRRVGNVPPRSFARAG